MNYSNEPKVPEYTDKLVIAGFMLCGMIHNREVPYIEGADVPVIVKAAINEFYATGSGNFSKRMQDILPKCIELFKMGGIAALNTSY